MLFLFVHAEPPARTCPHTIMAGILIPSCQKQIVDEAQTNRLSLIVTESKLSNCFTIDQLVGQNIILKKRIETSAKCDEFENRLLPLLAV